MRTYREWMSPSPPIAARTVFDARVLDAVRDTAWTAGTDGVRRLAPEGLRARKTTAHLRRTSPGASAEAVIQPCAPSGRRGERAAPGSARQPFGLDSERSVDEPFGAS